MNTFADSDKLSPSPTSKYHLRREKTHNQVVRNKSGHFNRELKDKMKSLAEDLQKGKESILIDLPIQRVMSFQAEIKKKRRVI